MLKPVAVLAIFIFVVNNVFVSSTSDCDEGDGLQQLQEGDVAFTGKFLYESVKLNPEVSLIFSPFSVLILLAQIALGASGNSLQQILKLLNFTTRSTISSVMPNYLDALNSQQNVTFSTAQKTYASDKYIISESFRTNSIRDVKAETQNLNFCNSQKSAEIINAWVADKTNNLITDLVSSGSLNCDTVLVLINAIYYKGDWKYAFDPENTEKQDFYINSDKTVTVNMMKQTGSFKYAGISDLDAQALELPYKTDNFTFLILLPNGQDGINNLVDKLEYSNYPRRSDLDNMYHQKVDVSIPTIDTSTTIDVTNILKKVNVTEIFYSANDLSGMLEDPQPISVSSAIQKATIIVNESGSEAAAATAIGFQTTSVAEPVENIVFNADHQFVYFILYQGTPLFCGVYAGPS